MSALHPLSHEQLVDYWAGSVDPEEESAIDEHVLGCPSCAEASLRVFEVVEALKSAVPPVVDGARVAQLEQQGVRIRRNPIAPGERKRSLFPRDVDILLHELGGLDLSSVARVDLDLQTEESEVLWHFDDVPFDVGRGQLLIACQRHFSDGPPNLVAVVHAHTGAGPTPVARYTLLHEWEM